MTRFGQFLANKQNCISTFKKSQNVGARQVLWAFGGFRVGGAPCWNKLALSQNLKNLHLNFLALPVTYFATNLVYHFTLRVTGIKNTLEQVTPHYTKISLLSTNCLAFIQEIRQAGGQSVEQTWFENFGFVLLQRVRRVILPYEGCTKLYISWQQINFTNYIVIWYSCLNFIIDIFS